MPKGIYLRKKREQKPITAQRIEKALRLLDKYERGESCDPTAKIAKKFYNMAERFFQLKGRFKRHYKRKKKVGK